MFQNKIFGIGLPKTGTFSLCFAMRLLGYKSIHYIKPNTYSFYKNIILKNDFINDCPINYIFDLLAEEFKNSKFICTTRNYDSWIKSSKKFFKKPRNNHSQPHMMSLFNSNFYIENNFRESYYFHQEKVKKFSKNNEVLFLPIESSSEIKWNLILNFLNLNKNITIKYPHLNISKPLII